MWMYIGIGLLLYSLLLVFLLLWAHGACGGSAPKPDKWYIVFVLTFFDESKGLGSGFTRCRVSIESERLTPAVFNLIATGVEGLKLLNPEDYDDSTVFIEIDEFGSFLDLDQRTVERLTAVHAVYPALLRKAGSIGEIPGTTKSGKTPTSGLIFGELDNRLKYEIRSDTA